MNIYVYISYMYSFGTNFLDDHFVENMKTYYNKTYFLE